MTDEKPLITAKGRGEQRTEADVALDNGDAALKKGDWDRAIANLSEAIRLDPKLAQAYDHRAYAYARKGESLTAIADYTEAIRVDPSDSSAYWGRGLANGKAGDLDQAIADFSEAIRLDPTLAQVYCNRGNAFAAKGESEEAVADYTRAIRLDPKCAKAYSERGLACGNRGNLDEAISDLSEAIRLDPKCARYHYNRGVAYGKKGEPDMARSDFEQAKKLGFTDFQPIDRLIDHVEELDTLELKELLEREVESPDDVNLLVIIGGRYLKLRQLDKTYEYYVRALQLDPDDGWTHLYLGTLHCACKRYADAIACFSRGAELLPDVASPYWCLGNVYRATGDDSLAEANYRKAVAAEPENRDARRYLEEWYVHRGKKEGKGTGSV